MNVIIIGCGRVGSQLATMLANNDHDVTVVDTNQNAFSALGYDFNGRTIKGVGFDEDVLGEADISSCDVFTAVTNDDNANLMAAEVARKVFHVPHVMTRLYSPERENTYLQLGLDYVCGTTLVAEELFSKIQSGHGHHIDTFGDYEIIRFSLRLPNGATSVKVSALERSHELRIAAFEHNGDTSIPTPDAQLHNGDIVVAGIYTGYLGDFEKYMK